MPTSNVSQRMKSDFLRENFRQYSAEYVRREGNQVVQRDTVASPAYSRRHLDDVPGLGVAEDLPPQAVCVKSHHPPGDRQKLKDIILLARQIMLPVKLPVKLLLFLTRSLKLFLQFSHSLS